MGTHIDEDRVEEDGRNPQLTVAGDITAGACPVCGCRETVGVPGMARLVACQGCWVVRVESDHAA